MLKSPGPDSTCSISARPNSAGQPAPQLIFGVRARGEVRVAAFRRHWHKPAGHLRQQRHAKSGARGDQRGAAVGIAISAPQHLNLRGLEHRDAPGERFQVVEQIGARHAELPAHRVRINLPRHVRQRRSTILHGSGDAEARARQRLHVHLRLPEKFKRQRSQIREIERAKRRGVHRDGPRPGRARRGPSAFSCLRRRPRAA